MAGRCGLAMDFFLGRVTRPHRDIDWFVLADDAEALRTAMLADGFADVTTASAHQQFDLQRGGIEHRVQDHPDFHATVERFSAGNRR